MRHGAVHSGTPRTELVPVTPVTAVNVLCPPFGPPDGPNVPDVPSVPDAPSVPDGPNVPDAPSVPDAPNAPDGPSAPEVPGVGHVAYGWSLAYCSH